MKRFPKKIKLLRECAGLSLRDAGEASGVNFKAIHNWEKGVAEPRPISLNRYLDMLKQHEVTINKGEILSLLGRGETHPTVSAIG